MDISLVLAVAGSTCKPTSEIASWGNPKNEPCYAHDGGMCNGEPAGRGVGLPSAASPIISPSIHTVGAYPVCCVTVGTCISVHGGMVSSTVCTLPPVPVPSPALTRDCLDAFPFAARLV